MSVISYVKIAIVIACVALFAAAQIRISILERKIETRDAAIDEATAQIEDLTRQVDSVRAQMARVEAASTVYVERIIEAENDHKEKIEVIESDPSACDWLDQPLPDSVRNTFGRACGRGAEDGAAAGVPTDAVRERGAGRSGNQPGSD